MPSRRRSLVEGQRSYDVIMGRYFFFTFFYGVVYASGAIVGYQKTRSLICLLVSGILGLLFILMGIGHGIDFYRPGVSIETFYVVLPFAIELILGIIFVAIWGLNGIFVPYGLVGFMGLVGFLFYGYAIARDFNNGKKYVRNYYQSYRPDELEGEPFLDLNSDAPYRPPQ